MGNYLYENIKSKFDMCYVLTMSNRPDRQQHMNA